MVTANSMNLNYVLYASLDCSMAYFPDRINHQYGVVQCIPRIYNFESGPMTQSLLTNLADHWRHRNTWYMGQGVMHDTGTPDIYPSSLASRQIMRIILLHLDKDGYIWDVIPKETRDFYWEEFQTEKYGREPTPMEVFTYTHTKDLDGHTFVDKRAVGVNLDHSAEEISALWAHGDAQERQLAELKAHVMRISGQHGSGTSSFDPPPATDPPVFTLHQPPSSSLNPDIADDTLVTPTDISSRHYTGSSRGPIS
ncbi:hypothetical protein JCGZ_17496 [Jatropha curcas]|uniref:Aminotransferase-like plant mobile domain-containing protein n=1 Tax=Jatropha curcas TaxID=180498 RepID=A0A067KER7_JATCU|nr:hypothetical protein JCGZ_17496 [Jatropha curcas]